MSGPLPIWMGPFAAAASVGYGAVIRARANRLEQSLAVDCGLPVISVGNITAGGTGKTPVTQWIARALQASGHAPMIALRGHKGGEKADEVLEHRAALSDIVVAVGADRARRIAAKRVNNPSCDVVVLDDGFQHRQLRRDCDLVLIDATRPALDDELLPLGWLREPVLSLRRASGVIVTRAVKVDDELSHNIMKLHGQEPLAWCRHAWTGLEGIEAGAVHEVSWLRRKRVAVWAGIGNPRAIVEQTESIAAAVVDVPRLADHARWDAPKVARLLARAQEAGADAILVTPKDWMKIAPLGVKSELPLVRPRLTIEFVQGESMVREQLARAVRVGQSRCHR
ncbi:MAG: tetraacyldisaccharide 4'-kinase [Phycisphaerales bacterium]|nr:tetraacyldisaccharide 4'-kinase [Phycisphaerales bacterium]